MEIGKHSTGSETPSLGDLISEAPAPAKAAILQAKALRNDGNRLAAKALLQDLADMYPDEKAIFVLLGHLHWDEADLVNAKTCFRKATELDPELEIASLALYHTLWSSGQEEEALAEMKRFLKVSHSEEYDRILQVFREETSGSSS